ncbi:hypothetical protein RRG08_027686 [Elysia crispata]|uniref:Uncharacterized protein n=1 Tax=Elysia crispata TaxID=231223 RepID=A0AAE0XMG4_9GAST|nr:hypothetical protein RRG08_027686 [Elysia crispata]
MFYGCNSPKCKRITVSSEDKMPARVRRRDRDKFNGTTFLLYTPFSTHITTSYRSPSSFLNTHNYILPFSQLHSQHITTSFHPGYLDIKGLPE